MTYYSILFSALVLSNLFFVLRNNLFKVFLGVLLVVFTFAVFSFLNYVPYIGYISDTEGVFRSSPEIISHYSVYNFENLALSLFCTFYKSYGFDENQLNVYSHLFFLVSNLTVIFVFYSPVFDFPQFTTHFFSNQISRRDLLFNISLIFVNPILLLGLFETQSAFTACLVATSLLLYQFNLKRSIVTLLLSSFFHWSGFFLSFLIFFVVFFSDVLRFSFDRVRLNSFAGIVSFLTGIIATRTSYLVDVATSQSVFITVGVLVFTFFIVYYSFLRLDLKHRVFSLYLFLLPIVLISPKTANRILIPLLGFSLLLPSRLTSKITLPYVFILAISLLLSLFIESSSYVVFAFSL
jgi:hypothetical protein